MWPSLVVVVILVAVPITSTQWTSRGENEKIVVKDKSGQSQVIGKVVGAVKSASYS